MKGGIAMAQLLVRDLDAGTINRLKKQAKRHGRSLQGEVKIILVGATDFSMREARLTSARWQERLAGRRMSDSTLLIREDRDR
jgi:plasmid stability protein